MFDFIPGVDFQVICDDMDSISVFKEGTGPPLAPPPLVAMAINIRITATESHENQITMISCLVHNQFHTDKPAPVPEFDQYFCGNLNFSKSSFQLSTFSYLISHRIPFDLMKL